MSIKMLTITKLAAQLPQQTAAIRNISLGAGRAIDQRWREQKGLPDNPNAFGPLANLPDYTFLDGRPTPMGSNQKRRMQKQQEIAAKIVTACSELKFAKERHARIKAEETAERKRILSSKLKPKGHHMLKKD